MSTAAPPAEAGDVPAGLYCSTSGTYFTDKEALAAHYRSDFHRYNLKRKVAGLPPVTREWYDARAAALKASLTTGGGGGAGGAGALTSLLSAPRAWLDPLTRKKFSSEATYRTFVSSNKYRELVKKSGQPAPEAVVVVASNSEGGGGGGGGGATTRSQAAAATATAAAAAKKKQQASSSTATTDILPIMATPTTSDAATAAAFRVAAPNGVTFAAGNDMETEGEEEDEAGANDDDSSGWETADEEDEIEPWDPTVSLFDNKKHSSVEACLEYMWKQFSFYIPDVSHCADPAGLLSYLGAKLRSGLVPLYTRGDDETGKHFRSLHAVQRHMVDLGNCRVCWEGNEDEYAEWYEWSDEDDDDEGDVEMDSDDEAAAGHPSAATNQDEAFELALPNGKVIGARAFAKFYRQSHRPVPRAAAAPGGARALTQPLSGAGAAARAANFGSGRASGGGGGGTSLALTAAAREQQRSAVVARYRAMGVKEADVPRAARKERQARKAQFRGRIRETLRANLAANVNRNLPKNVPY